MIQTVMKTEPSVAKFVLELVIKKPEDLIIQWIALE
jgi:hypothetical protein